MAIDEDELPKAPPSRLQKPVLDSLGIAELGAYIAELREEITRVEAEIARKQSHKSSADMFFRRP